jgi:hypothetical protein
LCDAFQVPKPLSLQLLPFGKSDDDLGELTFEVGLFSILSARGGWSARSVFFPCSSCSCSVSFSIHRGFEFSLGKVSDSPKQRADSPRVPGGQSACSPRTVRYSGSSLEVLCALSDGPPEPVCFASWFDSSLPFLCFRVCFKESFLRLEVDQ